METETKIKVINEELNWLSEVITQVINIKFKQNEYDKNWLDIEVPNLSTSNTSYARFVKEQNLNIYERLLLALVFAPQLQPEILDIFFLKNKNLDKYFSEFGFYLHNNANVFIPTGQTFALLSLVLIKN